MTGKDLVLVVDDDVAVRDSLKFALELEGLTVRTFGSGEAMLADAVLGEARCLVLDYKMPSMDGLEVLDRLATRKVRVPVILVVSNATGALRRKAQAAGAHQILEKPLLDGALLKGIQEVLARRQ